MDSRTISFAWQPPSAPHEKVTPKPVGVVKRQFRSTVVYSGVLSTVILASAVSWKAIHSKGGDPGVVPVTMPSVTSSEKLSSGQPGFIEVTLSQPPIHVLPQPSEDLSFEKCQAAAKLEAPSTPLKESFMAAWTALCVTTSVTTKLADLDLNRVPTAAEGRLLQQRGYKLASLENPLVASATDRAKFKVRQAVRWVGDHLRDIRGKDINEAALRAAKAVQTPDKHLNMTHLFGNVALYPERGPQTIQLTDVQVIQIATLCQNEADDIVNNVGETPVARNIGVQNCAAVIFNRLATGYFGSLASMFNPADFEALQQPNGMSGLYSATQDSIATVKHVIATGERYGDALYFYNRIIVDGRISSVTGLTNNVWTPYTRLGEVATPGKPLRSHEYANGIIQGGVLKFYEVPEYKVVIVNGKPQRPARPTRVAEQKAAPL